MNIVLTTCHEMPGSNNTAYRNMLALSNDSFMRNMFGFDELRVLTGRVDGFERVMKLLLFKLYEINRQGDNVFVIGPDVLCVRQIRFPTFVTMRMFGAAACEFKLDDPGRIIREYMNCQIMYFPAMLDEALWQMALRAMDGTFFWDRIQCAFNLMFWSQPLVQEDYDKFEKYGYNIPCDGSPFPHWIALDDADILHFHSTRGPNLCLRKMRERQGME